MLLLTNLCRTCNTEDIALVNIFAHKENQTSLDLIYMLEYCTQTTVKDNPMYPQGICYNCVKQLEISYRFLKRFHLAQNEFRGAHDQLQETVEKNCSQEIEKEVVSCFKPERIQINLSVSENKLSEHIQNVKCEKPPVEMTNDYIQPVNAEQTTEIETSDITIASLRPKLKVSQAVVCHICHKPFFTNKALNLHLKINHKRKLVFN